MTHEMMRTWQTIPPLLAARQKGNDTMPTEPLQIPSSPASGTATTALRSSVREILRLEQRDRIAMSPSDRIADHITALSGSMLYVWVHVAWFAVWIVVNIGWLPLKAFDPFPFGLLTMIVSLEAIFLATFVLISQNRQALQADRRAKIDLQIDVISEQEVSKILRVLDLIANHLGISEAEDAELERMEQSTNVTTLTDEIDAAESRVDPRHAKGPDSAVDTEA
jgi:uncharacterized membrane protein